MQTEMINKPNIAVIAGGDSSEFVVSVKSGANVFSAVDTTKFNYEYSLKDHLAQFVLSPPP